MQKMSPYLDPEVVSRLKTIDLKARLVVEGFLTGLHHSPYHGFSVEFAEHRPYNPGDAIRHIDWRVYGRTGKYYIKEYEEETNLKAYILLDCSNSMRYQSGGINKLEYGKTLAAALAWLMIKQRDGVGLGLFHEELAHYIPPKSRFSQLRALLQSLEQCEPSHSTGIYPVLSRLAEKIKRRGLIILISDLFDEPAQVMQALRNFRYRQHEVLVFHILDPRERDLDFRQDIEFIDLETEQKLVSQPWLIKKDYCQKIEELTEYYQTQCHNDQIDYQLFDTQVPYDQTLLFYLEKRKRLG